MKPDLPNKARMTACEECREQLPGLALQALDPPEAERVQAHLEGCAGCQESLEELRSTFAAADAWRVPEPASGLAPRIRQALAAEPVALSPWKALLLGLERLARYRPSPAASFACVLVGICLFGIVLYPNTQRYHSEGGVAGCRNNQDILRTALTDYASDHQGHYPPDLGALDPVYVRSMPTCPFSGTDTYSGGYQVSPSGERYTLDCGSTHR